jgi:hypothetical protein
LVAWRKEAAVCEAKQRGPKTEEKGRENTRGGREDGGSMELGTCCTVCLLGAGHCAFMGASGPGELLTTRLPLGIAFVAHCREVVWV